MNKEIYQDSKGLYFVEYDLKGNPKKVYCNEEGQTEIYQDKIGLYYVEYDEKGEPAKVYCDNEGNRISVTSETSSDNRLDEEVTPATEVKEPVSPEKQAYVSQQQETVNMENNTATYGQAEMLGNISATTAASAATGAADSLYKKNNKQKKSKALVILGTFLALAAVTVGGYFAYGKFLAKPSVNLENYQISFTPKGSNGQGTPEVKIDGIPMAENIESKSQEEITEIDKLLVDPKITYSKSSGLSNGDQVEVNIGIDSEKAKEQGLEVSGKFKQSFTVSGLSEASKSSSSANSEKKEGSSNSNESEKKSSSNEPNKNWFVVNGQHRADNGDHPDTQLRNGFNSWASGQGLSLERMKGGAEFGGEILGNKIMYNGKATDLRFIRYRGETEETVKGGELLKDTYNVVGVFSDKSSVIYITAIYNGKAQVFKAKLSGGKPETKDGLIVFEDANNSEVKNMLQGIIDRMK